jgi:hypothetical protein
MFKPVLSTVIAAFIFAQVDHNFFDGRYIEATITVLQAISASLGL